MVADPCYPALGNTAQQRSERYRTFVHGAVSQAELSLIREGLQRGQPTGDSRFFSRYVYHRETRNGSDSLQYRSPGPQSEPVCEQTTADAS